jgi:phage major head subunit gpT-like protein
MALDTARAVTNLRGLTARFDIAVQNASPFYPEVCTVVQSTGAEEQYGFLGSVPGMREWLGDRVFNSLRGATYTLLNKEWEDSVRVEKNDIDDGRFVKYESILEQMGIESAHHPDELLLSLIVDGETKPAFDGQYFFDTDHAWGDSGSQSNDLTHAAASGTTPTEAEFRAAYHAARAAMLGFKNDQGKLFIRPTVRPFTNLMLMVSPNLEEVANQALMKTLVSSGETNIVLDRPRSIVPIGGFTSTTKFYLLNLSQALKPFVFQARRPLARQMKGMDDREFKDVKFMTDARYNMGYGAWWNAVLMTFT